MHCYFNIISLSLCNIKRYWVLCHGMFRRESITLLTEIRTDDKGNNAIGPSSGDRSEAASSGDRRKQDVSFRILAQLFGIHIHIFMPLRHPQSGLVARKPVKGTAEISQMSNQPVRTVHDVVEDIPTTKHRPRINVDRRHCQKEDERPREGSWHSTRHGRLNQVRMQWHSPLRYCISVVFIHAPKKFVPHLCE